MRCPSCANPNLLPTESRCKCGFTFTEVMHLGAIRSDVRTIKIIVVFWFVLMIIAGFLAVAVKVMG